MKVLDRIQSQADKAASKISLKVNYIPDILEGNDLYQAYNIEYNISNYGSTPERAIANARAYASSLFYADSILLAKALGK